MSQTTAILQTAMVKGHQIDLVPLETVDYARLASREPIEVEKLFKASQMPGFFYLNLESDPTGHTLADLKDVYALAERYFDQPHEEKMKGYRADQDRGYKPGANDETFEARPLHDALVFLSLFLMLILPAQIARDERVQKTLVLPCVLDNHAKLFGDLSSACDSITQTMLSCLSDALNLEGIDRFEHHHRNDQPSDTGLKLCYKPEGNTLAEVGGNQHTDSGTLTLLFCDRWGVQLEHPETKKWAFVVPKPGHALINIADTLQALSGDRLHSCLHRVVQPAGVVERRYSVVYFLRPGKQ